MGLMTSLLVGGALAGGLFLGSKLTKRGNNQTTAPETVLTPEETPEAKVAATNPPVAEQQSSENTAEALKAATRTRRRASAGNSGRVTTGPGGTPGVGAGGSARSLIGS